MYNMLHLQCLSLTKAQCVPWVKSEFSQLRRPICRLCQVKEHHDKMARKAASVTESLKYIAFNCVKATKG